MVLVDSSVWIDFFRGSETARPLNRLIDANTLCVNDLILAELIPSIRHKHENAVENLLLALTRVELEIDWSRIMAMQTANLRNGVNRVGIADLIIAQNAIDNDLELFTSDKHFALMRGLHGLRLFGQQER